MKTHLTKKIFSFILITIGMFFFSAAHAQIVYTDVNPDTQVGDYSVDINNDGVNDFTLVQTIITGFMVKIAMVSTFGLNENAIAVGDSLSAYPAYPLALDSGISIGPDIKSFSTTGGTMRYQNSNRPALGYWKNDVIDYLGIKLIMNDSIFYGWIKLSVYAKGNVPTAHETLISYAYNSNPNQPILAGQLCPPQSAIATSGPTTFCLGDSVILSSENSGTNLSYKWKLNGSNISGATNKSYTAKIAGKYKVNVKDNTSNCTATSTVTKVKVPCRILNEELTNSENDLMKAYPNPASDKITLSFSSFEKRQIQIINTLGQIVFAEEINSAKEEIDVSHFQLGIYVVSAQTSTQKIEKKFLKQ